MGRRLATIILAAAVLTGAAACSSSSSSGSSSSSSKASSSSGSSSSSSGSSSSGKVKDTAEKVAFVKKANAICKSTNTELAKLATNITTEAQLATALKDSYVPAVRKELDAIEALGFPAGSESVQTAMTQSRKILDQIEADPNKFTNAADPFADVNKTLRAYGLTDCGGSATDSSSGGTSSGASSDATASS